MVFEFKIPPFIPHPLIRGAHAQTLAGVYLPGPTFSYQAVMHRFTLPDGDVLVLHDDRPTGWRPGDRVALLLHGLAGCHQSAYMIRIAAKLEAAGVRAFRMDHRGCGAGRGLASRPYHAGRSEDARAALEFLRTLCGDSPTTVIGFSLSGNIVLKLLGEDPESLPANVEKGLSVNPALDLGFCVRSLVGPMQRIYDRHFVRLLCRQIEENRRINPAIAPVDSPRAKRSLFDFDDAYTGPVGGFGTADDYYSTNSAARHVAEICVPTLILSAADDPLVPASCFENLDAPSNVLIHIARHGGHLGYVGRRGVDPDRRWMDWRIVDWVKTDIGRRNDRTSVQAGERAGVGAP